MKRLFPPIFVAFALLWAQAASAYTNTYCLTSSASPLALSTLVGWNNANNEVIALGAGGDGFLSATAATSGGAGGSGGLSFATNVTLSTNNGFQVGVRGGGATNTAATWLCNGTASCTSTNSGGVVVGIRGATTATSTTGAAGGATTSATGTPTAGSQGGSGGASKGGGGGAGAPGLNGAGVAGVNGTSSGGFFGAGGAGDSSTGGAGGATVGAAGGNGAETATCSGDVSGAVGAGGGGAGTANTATAAGNAGTYGAGGGGAWIGGTAGQGKGGIIILEWTPVAGGGAPKGTLLGVGP